MCVCVCVVLFHSGTARRALSHSHQDSSKGKGSEQTTFQAGFHVLKNCQWHPTLDPPSTPGGEWIVSADKFNPDLSIHKQRHGHIDAWSFEELSLSVGRREPRCFRVFDVACLTLWLSPAKGPCSGAVEFERKNHQFYHALVSIRILRLFFMFSRPV